MDNIADLERELAVVNKQTEELIKEEKWLTTEAETIEIRLKEIKIRLSELRNGYRRFGEIGQSKAKAKRIEGTIKDLQSRLVVWAVTRTWGHTGRQYVVSRVTPKRIYIREVGAEREIYYDHDGSRGTYDGKIDIEQTFPEGLDEYRKQTK